MAWADSQDAPTRTAIQDNKRLAPKHGGGLRKGQQNSAFTSESARAASAKGRIKETLLRSAASKHFQNMTEEETAAVKERGRELGLTTNGGAAGKGIPKTIGEGSAVASLSFGSFAQKIRYLTNDGWELVNAIYEVFSRAREAKADGLIMESATWLADRGFGKPVQVGQLLGADGNAVAFTLWQPVAPVGLPAPKAEEETDVIEHEAIQRPPEEYKHPVRVVEETDALSAGPIKAWTTSKVDPISGEET